jgi:hypothetical protein
MTPSSAKRSKAASNCSFCTEIEDCSWRAINSSPDWQGLVEEEEGGGRGRRKREREGGGSNGRLFL